MMKHTLNHNIKFVLVSCALLCFQNNITFAQETKGYITEIVTISDNGQHVGAGLFYFKRSSLDESQFIENLYIIDSANTDPIVGYGCCVLNDIQQVNPQKLKNTELDFLSVIDYSFINSKPPDYAQEIRKKSTTFIIKHWSVVTINCFCKSDFSNLSELSFKANNRYNIVFFKNLNLINHDLTLEKIICKKFRKIIRKDLIE